MTYRIAGLGYGPFEKYFAMDAEELAEHRACRVRAEADRGFPCRVSLEDARKGESLILVHHTSHDVETPYRSAYAIFVREGARRSREFVDELPPVFEGRPIALRGFAANGMLSGARLAVPGETDRAIRELFEDEGIAYIDAHNAAQGCFAARIEQDGQ